MPAANTLLTLDQLLFSFHHLAAQGALILFLVESALIASLIWLRRKNDAALGASSLDA
jgi:hypothetical protein